MKKNTVNTKTIKSFIDFLIHSGMVKNQAEFGMKIGYENASSFSTALKNPSQRLIAMINSTFPEFGKFRVGENNITPVAFDDYMEVEYVRQSSVAGKVGMESISDLPKHRRLLVPKEFESGNYIVVKIDGDSMDDGTNISIPDGSDILVRQYFIENGGKLPIRNNLFVIVTTTGTVFKQIIEHNTDDGYIICHSYNPAYKDYQINMEDVLQIFIYRKIVNSRPPIPEI